MQVEIWENYFIDLGKESALIRDLGLSVSASNVTDLPQ